MPVKEGTDDRAGKKQLQRGGRVDRGRKMQLQRWLSKVLAVKARGLKFGFPEPVWKARHGCIYLYPLGWKDRQISASVAEPESTRFSGCFVYGLRIWFKNSDERNLPSSVLPSTLLSQAVVPGHTCTCMLSNKQVDVDKENLVTKLIFMFTR